MKFNTGQEIVCIYDNWSNVTPSKNDPKKGQLVTVDHYERAGLYICLIGYDHSWYLESCFDELPSMEEVNKALEVLIEKV
jgi:hypothetical protein